jgi:hypothetical protein
MASRVVGGDNNRALFFDIDANTPLVMTPGAPLPPITSLETIAEGDEALVGRPVNLANAKIEHAFSFGGFIARVGDHRVFVLMPPGTTRPTTAAANMLSGVVLAMPDELEARLDVHEDVNDEIYIYVFPDRPQR